MVAVRNAASTCQIRFTQPIHAVDFVVVDIVKVVHLGVVGGVLEERSTERIGFGKRWGLAVPEWTMRVVWGTVVTTGTTNGGGEDEGEGEGEGERPQDGEKYSTTSK